MSMLRRINCAEATDRASFFVLGALDAREAIEVRDHLETCSQPHTEFRDAGGVVPYLAAALEPAEPSADLRRRLLEAVDGDLRARRRDDTAAERLVASFEAPSVPATPPPPPVVAPAPPAPAPQPVAAPAAVTAARPAPRPATAKPAVLEPVAAPSRGRRRWLLPLAVAAAVALIAALGAWNMVLQQNAAQAQQRAALLRDAIVASQAPDSLVARLDGTDTAPNASGFVAMPSDGPGYLVVEGLNPAPPGRTYEAWFIQGDEQRPAGLLEVAPDGLAVLSGLAPDGPVEAVGVTLERTGGADEPSDPLLLQGTMPPG
jgi:Anti-sigma-K factor rskA, C-terminal/Putative zinc-finger